MRGVIVVSLLQEGEHTATETLAFLLLHSFLSCSIGCGPITLLLSLLVGILLLPALSFLLLLLVSQLLKEEKTLRNMMKTETENIYTEVVSVSRELVWYLQPSQ